MGEEDRGKPEGTWGGSVAAVMEELRESLAWHQAHLEAQPWGRERSSSLLRAPTPAPLVLRCPCPPSPSMSGTDSQMGLGVMGMARDSWLRVLYIEQETRAGGSPSSRPGPGPCGHRMRDR